MRDIFLDPDTGDLSIVSGKIRLTTPGVEASAQRLRVRLRLFRGEYVLDRRVGMPYADFLGKKGVLRRYDEMLRSAVRTCPGVASLNTFLLTLDADRLATVTLSASALDGQPIDLAGFIVGSPEELTSGGA